VGPPVGLLLGAPFKPDFGLSGIPLLFPSDSRLIRHT